MTESPCLITSPRGFTIPCSISPRVSAGPLAPDSSHCRSFGDLGIGVVGQSRARLAVRSSQSFSPTVASSFFCVDRDTASSRCYQQFFSAVESELGTAMTPNEAWARSLAAEARHGAGATDHRHQRQQPTSVIAVDDAGKIAKNCRG